STGRIEEVEPVRRRVYDTRAAILEYCLVRAEDDGHRSRALALYGFLGGYEFVGAISGDEIDDGFRVLEVECEINPAVIGLQLTVAVRKFHKLLPRLIQRRHASITAARDIDGGKIKGDSDKLVAQHVC